VAVKARLLLLVSALGVLAVYPSAGAGEVSFGAKTGMVLAYFTQAPQSWEPNMSLKPGFALGAFLRYRFSDRFSLQPELLYAQRGVVGNLYDGFIPVDVTAKVNYVELPLLAVYTFPLKGSLRPNLYAGPVLAYTLSSELEFSASVLSASVDVGSLTHVNDFGLVIGTGFGLAAGSGTMTFDIRYQLGFTNVIVSGDFEINGDPKTIVADDIKNSGFAILLGYLF
jgi:hypothetical protein